MELRKNRAKIDWVFLLTVVVLVIIGLLTIYSTGYNGQKGGTDSEFYMQLLWIVLGAGLFFLTITVDYHKYVEWALYLYALGLILLLATLVLGSYQRNIKAWIGIGKFSFQPSEFMKLFAIVALAKFLTLLGDAIRDIRNFFISFLVIIPPMALISLQPDFGTALVFVPMAFAMMFISGARVGHIISLVALSGLALGIPLVVAYFKVTGDMNGWLISILSSSKILLTVSVVLAGVALLSFLIYFFVRGKVFMKFALAVVIIPLGLSAAAVLNNYLKPYQQKRIAIFIDPEIDPRGAGYNIIQSKIAIGSGGLVGKGFMKGSQSQLSFLPEKKTDFVFSSFGEEWGFLGCFFLIGVYFLFIYKGVMIIYHSRDLLGSLIATGVVSMFLFHIFINIGMATGMMPVTGLPLPFISYGGSNLLMNLVAVGLLFNIEMRRYVH